MTTDYATRRDTAVRNTLAAIDAAIQDATPLADAVEDTLHVQLPAWQRHVLAVMSRIRRIRPGRTR